MYEAEANGNVHEQFSIGEWFNMLVNKYLVRFKIAEEGMDLDMNDSFNNHEHNINYDEEAAEIERQREVNNECRMSTGLYTDTNSDNDSFMTRRVKNHKKYTRITSDNRRLCPTASSMVNIAHDYKKKQAEMVNKKRAEYMKPVLDCGDIVSIQVPSQSRGACDHP